MNPPIRPFGYVEEDPIIRRIGDRELYLGNRLAADSAAHDRTFEYVLSLTIDEQPLTTHHQPMQDGPDTDWQVFEQAVETARQLYRHEGSLLIHCKAGVSRSTTLIAVTIAIEEGRSFREALDMVQEARPIATPHYTLHELALIYLAAEG